MFKNLVKKGLDAVASTASAAAEAVESSKESIYVPGAVRAAAVTLEIGIAMGDTFRRVLAQTILKDVGITCKADLEKAKWTARDKDCDACMGLFD